MSREVACFWLESAGIQRVRLRRYTYGVPKGGADVGDHVRCPNGWVSDKDGYQSGHEARGPVVADGEEAHIVDGEGGKHWASRDDWDPHDPRWPTTCDVCKQPLPAGAIKQTFVDHLYRRVDTGALTTLSEAAPGAMWDAWWYSWKGPDGRSIMVKLPDGTDWSIDGRASNCGLPDDREHHCWVRHGDPPILTVDKDGAPTCNAGAGSIATPDYHGFLRGGVLID